MTTVLYVLLRFVIVVSGFIFACLATSLFLHIIYFATAQEFTAELAPLIILGSIVSVPFIAFLIAVLTALPCTLVVLAGEFLPIRNWLFYAISGGVFGLIVLVMISQEDLRAPADVDFSVSIIHLNTSTIDAQFFGMMVGGGIVGGMAYWLVAGQFAGRRRDLSR